jgi:hypothetical protein
MVKKLKLNIILLDKHRIFKVKADYDPETRLAETTKGLRRTVVQRFLVDPDHIYLDRKRSKIINTVFVDNAQLKSVPIKSTVTIKDETGTRTENKEVMVQAMPSIALHTDCPIDQRKATELNVLTEKSFWKALIEKRKLPLSTTLILLAAGMGLYQIIVLIIRALGGKV